MVLIRPQIRNEAPVMAGMGADAPCGRPLCRPQLVYISIRDSMPGSLSARLQLLWRVCTRMAGGPWGSAPTA